MGREMVPVSSARGARSAASPLFGSTLDSGWLEDGICRGFAHCEVPPLSPPPRPCGRTESCTLRILTDTFTSAHGKRVARDVWGGAPRPRGRGPRRGSNLSVTYLIGGPLPVSSIRQEALPKTPKHEERTERCAESPSFGKVLLDFWSGFRYPYRETVTPFGEDSYYGKYGRFAA